MRYSASAKLEIIELVEQSWPSIRRTLTPVGIPRTTFYDWYNRYQQGGIRTLEDGNPTAAPNQLRQIDFTYLKVIGWG